LVAAGRVARRARRRTTTIVPAATPIRIIVALRRSLEIPTIAIGLPLKVLATGAAVEIWLLRTAVWAPVSIAPAIRAAVEIRPRAAGVRATVEFRGPHGTDDGRRTIVDRVTAPAIPVAIEVPVAIVAIPVVSDAEDHRRDSERTIIVRAHVDTPALIERLNIATGNPAATAVEFHIAPRHISKATMNLHGFAGGDDRDGRILGAGPGAHIDVGGGKSFSRLSNRRRQQEGGRRGDLHQDGLHVSTPLTTQIDRAARVPEKVLECKSGTDQAFVASRRFGSITFSFNDLYPARMNLS